MKAGFSNVIASYNGAGETDFIRVHANNVSLTTEGYVTGPDTYNSLIISGTIASFEQYGKMILLVMSLKPLEIVVYDNISFDATLLLNENTALFIR